LTEEERDYLLKLISTGTGSAKRLTHARILLKAITLTTLSASRGPTRYHRS